MLRRVYRDPLELVTLGMKIRSDERAQVIRNGAHRNIRRDCDKVGLGLEVREANDRRAQCFPNLDMIEPDEERQWTTITLDVFPQFALARDV